MSARRNPDSRPLPPGWVEQYDASYNTWFYVNTRANPPTSSWTHPSDVQTQRPSSNQYGSQYGAPSGPPPQNSYSSGYDQPPPQRSQWGPSAPITPSWGSQNPNQSSPWGQQQQPSWDRTSSQSSGFGGYPQAGGYGSPPGRFQQQPQQPQPTPTWGSAATGYPQSQPQFGGGFNSQPQSQVDEPSRGFFGGSSQQTSAQPRRSGPGMGTALLAGAGGLAVGALLENAIEGHERREYEEGYERGADNQFAQDNFGDDGGDF